MGDFGGNVYASNAAVDLRFYWSFFFFMIFQILIYGLFISKIKDQKFAVGFFFFEVYVGLKKKGQVQVRVCKFVL